MNCDVFSYVFCSGSIVFSPLLAFFFCALLVSLAFSHCSSSRLSKNKRNKSNVQEIVSQILCISIVKLQCAIAPINSNKMYLFACIASAQCVPDIAPESLISFSFLLEDVSILLFHYISHLFYPPTSGVPRQLPSGSSLNIALLIGGIIKCGAYWTSTSHLHPFILSFLSHICIGLFQFD
jgi:hypothetical protein